MLRVCATLCAGLAVVGCGSDPFAASADPDADSSGEDRPENVEPMCGNGRREEGEDCDLGVGNEVGALCTSLCTVPTCGDAILAPWEECDDGNEEAGDGCSPSCLVEGRPLWSVTVDGDEREEAIWDLAIVQDTIVAVGTTNRSFFDTVPLVVGIDPSDGTVRFRANVESAFGDGIARRVLAADGDAVVAGTMVDNEAGALPWIARFGRDGTLRYSEVLDIAGASGATAMIRAAPERALVSGGFAWAPGSPRRGWVAEIDLVDASIVWQAQIETEQELVGVDDIAALADGWVVGGRSPGRKWVGRYDANWSLVWERTWDHGYATGSIAVTGDAEGRVYVAGAVPIAEPVTSYDLERWIVALEPDGVIAWEVVEPARTGATDTATDIEVDGNGGVWVSGQVKQQPLLVSAPWDVDAWIQRYDRNGIPTDGYVFDGTLHGFDRALGIVVAAADTVIVGGSSAVLFEGQNPWVASFGPGNRPPIPRHQPPPPVDRKAHPRSNAQHRASLFIDFGGRELRPGNWGTHGELPCLGEPVPFPGFFGTREDAELIVTVAEELLAPYGIAVHWKRRPPAHLPYTTVAVGGSPEQLGLDPQVKGFACSTDCNDNWSRDLALVFDANSRTIAMNIVHEAGHTWGLDHEVGSATVMQPFVGPGNTWSTECTLVSHATSQAACDAVHRMFCPSGHQNSDAVLTATFGTADPDDVAPAVEILAPRPGSVHRSGEAVVLEVDVSDDRGNPGYRVSVDALGWSRIAVGRETPFELHLPSGTFEIHVDAIDHASNRTTRSVTVQVEP